MDLVAVASVCAAECERQHVGLDRVAMLIDALHWAQNQPGQFPTVQDLLTLAGRIEPDSRGAFRTVPVTFANGNTGAPPGTVSSAVERLVDLLDDDTDPQEWVRSFEVIHPFTDGNGRVGFVLYNWLRGTLTAPVPLPDFDF